MRSIITLLFILTFTMDVSAQDILKTYGEAEKNVKIIFVDSNKIAFYYPSEGIRNVREISRKSVEKYEYNSARDGKDILQYRVDLMNYNEYKRNKEARSIGELNSSNKKKGNLEGFGSFGFGIGAVTNSFGGGFSFDRVEKDIGFSFDILVNFNPPENYFYKNISFNQAKYTFNDTQLGDVTGTLMFNFGPNVRLSKDVALLGGVSIAINTIYTQFYDKFEILGDRGKYYVENSNKTEGGVYGGLYIKTNNNSALKIVASSTKAFYVTYNLIMF